MGEERPVLHQERLGDDGEGEPRSIWKIVLIALVIGLVVLIALGLLRYWMVHYYGGW